MSDNIPELREFNYLCNEICEAKYIFSNIKIKELLQYVASNEKLLSIIAECTKGYDFASCLEHSKVLDLYGINRKSIKMPTLPREALAFTFSILVAFDNKSIDSHKFINEFFYADGSSFESYKRFCLIVIGTLKRSMEAMFIASTTEVEKGMKARFLVASQVDTIVDQCREIVKIIEDSTTISTQVKSEMIEITEGFANVLLSRSDDVIRILWIGLKNTLKQEEKVVPNLLVIDRTLSDVGIN